MTWQANTSAFTARARRRWAIAVQAFYRACHRTSAALSGAALSMTPWRGPNETLQSARASALANLTALQRRKYELQVEKEIVAAERKEAIRQHKAVLGFNRRLKAITNELLSIG